MALDNYTRGQKIFMVVLVVLLAAMFTVTGAMITLFGQGGESVPPDHGSIDGRQIRLVSFQQKRRALNIIGALDAQAMGRTGESNVETIYAQVPALSPRADFDFGGQASMTSLLNLWPRYQDQNVWCHIVLTNKAREAGVAPPSPSYMGALITALMNEAAEEFDKFEQRDLPRRFAQLYGSSLDEFVPTMAEAVMVRDYVESLLAAEKARLEDIARIASGNTDEFRSQYMHLSIDAFMDRAEEDVRRDNFTYRAAQIAGGMGVASRAMGYDRFEEAYDKNRAAQLQQDARFEVEIIKAFPEEMRQAGNVPVEEEAARLIYEAVKDEVYKATAADVENLASRITEARNDFARRNSEAVRDWGEDEWTAWEADVKPNLEKYRSFAEVRTQLYDSLRQRDGLRAAQSSIARLASHLAAEKRRRERQLNARLDSVRKEKAIYDGQKTYLDGLRGRFDSAETQLHASLRNISNRIRTQAEGEDAAANARALDTIVSDFTRELSSFETSQINTLVSTASAVAQNLENSLNTKAAELEDFKLRESHTAEDGTPLTSEEVASKQRSLELEIEAFRKRIELRDAKLPLVEALAEQLRASLAAYDLRARSAAAGELELRRFVLRELLVEIPATLGKNIREGRDSIIPEAETQELQGQAELIQADIDARQSSLSKDAADTRGPALNRWITERASLGLRIESPGYSITWEELINGEYAWLENVNGAKNFLEGAQSAAGATSDILELPGKGYLILRLGSKTPKYALGRIEAHDRAMKLAAMLRARELCVEAMKDVRRKALDDGWDAAVALAQEKYSDAFSVRDTGWFRSSEDIPGLYSHNDNDVLNYTTAPAATNPDQPFVNRLNAIRAKEGISEIIPEKFNEDVLRRPDHDRWAYMLARVTDRRAVEKRMERDDMQEQGSMWSPAPADIWRNRHLAASSVVRDLIEPARVLEGRNILQFKPPSRDDDKKEGEQEPTT